MVLTGPITNMSSTNNLWNTGARTVQRQDATMAYGTYRNGAMLYSDLLRIKQAQASVIGANLIGINTYAMIGDKCCKPTYPNT